MMLVFLIDVDASWKTGLFNAIESRVKYYSPDLVLNISYVDSFLLSNLKLFFGKKINKPKENFSFDQVTVDTVELERGVIELVMSKFSISNECLLMLEAKKILKIINSANVNNEQIDLIAHWGLTAGIYSYFLRDFVSRYFNFYHGSDVHTEPRKDKKILKLTKSAMKNAKINFFVSKGLLAVAKELGYSGDNNAISYNGINISDFKSPRIKGQYPVIGFAGNLFEVKGADLLPAIFSEVKKIIPNVVFKVAGDGYLFSKIANDFNVHQIDVEMLGKLQPNEMPAYFSSLDLLVIPSRNEALSIAAIEALSSGCNVVASNTGGLPEVLDAEFLVDWSPNFIEEFSKKICLVLCNKPAQILKPCFEQGIALESEYKKIIDMN